jgi:hypothetical protein
MVDSDSAAFRPQLAALVDAAQSGQHQPVYLFIGESFETRAAAQAVLDTLVPASRRAFNLETYDGRTTALAQVIDSLRTPPFLWRPAMLRPQRPRGSLASDMRARAA